MIRNLLLVFIAFSFSLIGQDCMYLFISEYVEGTANSKGIEIYNPTDQAIDLSDYQVIRYSNGSSTASDGYKTQLVGTIQPKGTHILVNGQTTTSETSPACDPALQALADQLDGEYPAPMYMNGNDAIVLEQISTGIVLDIFGKVGENPGYGWTDIDTMNYITGDFYWWLAWTKDHTLIRKSTVKHGVFTNPGEPGAPVYFDPSVEWDTVPGYWSEEDTAWVSANLWDDLGQHDCECNSTGIETIKKSQEAYFFPNPVINNNFTIKATDLISKMHVYNALGQQVHSQTNDVMRGEMFVELNINKRGLYFVKIEFSDGNSITKKLLFD